MPEFTVSPDGTRLIAVEAPVQETVIQQGQPQVTQAGQEQLDLLRQQLGLANQTATNPAVQGSTPTQPSAPTGTPMSIKELVEKGLLDPTGNHDLTQLESYKRTVSKLQSQAAQQSRVTREQQLAQIPEQLQQRQAQARQELDQRLQTAAPHERIQLERDFANRMVQERDTVLNAVIQEQQDSANLEGWKSTWVQEEGIPPQIIQQLEMIAEQNPQIRSASDRYEFLNMATRKFLNDRANGRFNPGSGQPTNQPPVQPQQQFQPQGVPYTPVVAPSNSGVGQVGINQKFSAALQSVNTGSNEEQDRSWKDLYKSLGINIGGF